MPYLSACVLVYLEHNQLANEFIRVYNANICILSKVDKLSAHRQPPILRYCDFSFGFDFTGTATGATLFRLQNIINPTVAPLLVLQLFPRLSVF